MNDTDSNGKFISKKVKKGDIISSADWNAANKEIERLGEATTNLNQNDFKGALTIEEALTVKGDKVDIGEKEKNTEVNLEGNIIVSKTVRANHFVGVGALVKGMIIMWSGELENIPEGWVLCDGNNNEKIQGLNTPDLRDRFIVGAGGEYQPYKKGGTKEVTLSDNNIPLLEHNIIVKNHSHYTSFIRHHRSFVGEGDKKSKDKVLKADSSGDKYWHGENSNEAKVEITVDNHGYGTPDPINISPPFFALAFIMYVGID